jgi:cobalt-zinc-cadmium efflux system outer membrane protein
MRLGLLRSSLTLAENNQRLTARSVEEGLRAPLDLNRELVFVNGLRVKVEIAESELAEVESRLCILLSRETLEGLELPEALPSARLESINAKALHEFAVERRPDVLEKRAGIRIAKGLLGRERAERRPRVDLMLGLRDMTAGFPFTAIDMNGNLSPIEDRMRFSAVGFKIGLPLFNWNQGNISAAEIEVESRGESTSQAELEVRNELDAAISKFNRTSRSLELMIRGVASQARENLRVVRIAYNEGAMSLDEFLREQRALIDVELDLIDVARLNSVTEAELIASVGVASFSELMQAIQSGRTK